MWQLTCTKSDRGRYKVIATQSCSLIRVIPHAFEETLDMLRSALQREGLQIICEVPFHREFRKSMGVTCVKYSVLVVWSQFETWRAVLTEDDAGLLMPFNIAIKEDGNSTMIAVNNWIGRCQACASVGVSLMVHDTEARMRRVFDACDPANLPAEVKP